MLMNSGVERCVTCTHHGVSVTNSRPHDFGRIRTRECNKCGHTWQTIELPIEVALRLHRASQAIDTAANAVYIVQEAVTVSAALAAALGET